MNKQKMGGAKEVYTDTSVKDLSNSIEMLRQELNLKGAENIRDPHVYRMSCELDRLIFDFYKSEIHFKENRTY
ncbi:aspartyl-phosphate phosphatase Spo0E family protein [Ammoniphilus sp. 3BR4]|uniref:aspartyl-phosphate phosphatase Spo0E family protein n=1 Tax=Ammoniphilus sp. 3BR4 TaxID=3158265 RepID=UPI0034656DF8